MRRADGVIHWPTVLRAATGFLAVMAIGWTFARVTGWDWLALLSMVPGAALGYWWANRYERRAGVAPAIPLPEADTDAKLRMMAIILVAAAVTSAIGRQWVAATVTAGAALLTARNLVAWRRATGRRAARDGAR